MLRKYIFQISILFACQSVFAQNELPDYSVPTIFARTGITSFNLPNGSSIASPTISLDDEHNVSLDVNFVGDTGNPGVFYGTYSGNQANGSIVYNANDIITGDPSLNGQEQALFSVGISADLFLYDAKSDSTAALNFPLGVTSGSSLTLDGAQRIGGRLRFGFDGDVYGTFSVQESGFPSINVYASDSDIDVSSPYSFLYSPDMSRESDMRSPRIAAKVSTVAGFDFEEIRIFDVGNQSTLVAVETETDPMSPYSEFVTNSVAISDNGSKVAFQAVEASSGNSGIFLYDDATQSILMIASTADAIVNSIDIFSPDVNDLGMVVFRGDDDDGNSSVFIGNGIELIRLAGEGDLIATDLGERQLGRRDQDFSQSGAPRINSRGDVGFIFQYHDPANSNSIADGSLIMVAMTEGCLPGDLNGDKLIDLLDVAPFVEAIVQPAFVCEADVNGDGVVDLLDVGPFVDILTGG